MTSIELIKEERHRQECGVCGEGWSIGHDDSHVHSELARAALSYLKLYISPNEIRGHAPEDWPWEAAAWKPQNPMRNLVKAGALIAAEIDRLQRAAAE